MPDKIFNRIIIRILEEVQENTDSQTEAENKAYMNKKFNRDNQSDQIANIFVSPPFLHIWNLPDSLLGFFVNNVLLWSTVASPCWGTRKTNIDLFYALVPLINLYLHAVPLQPCYCSSFWILSLNICKFKYVCIYISQYMRTKVWYCLSVSGLFKLT